MPWIAPRLALVCAALLAASASAVVVADLHATAVVVPDQSPDQRAKAFRAALAAVVVRLTGDRAAPDAPELAALMRAPQRLVGEFSYAEEPVPPAPGAAPRPAAAPVPMRTVLRVRFEAVALERALREAGRVVWGRERPRTLVWLVLDDGPERDLVGAEDADAFVAAAADRALPLQWPALDGEDRAALTLPDLAALDEPKVRAASARHPAEAVLAGRALRAGTGWRGQFLWLMGDDFERFEVAGPTADAIAAAAFDRLAGNYVARFGVRNEELPAVVEVAVEGVADVAAYARVFAYLQELSPVRKVDLIGSVGDVLRLRVTFRGDVPTLERIIALDPTLGRSTEPPAANALRYRFGGPAAPAAGTPVPPPAPST
jgi:hypothetical protein